MQMTAFNRPRAPATSSKRRAPLARREFCKRLFKLSHRKVRWDSQRSSFELRHRGVGELRPACRARVALDFFKCLMAGDRHDLMRGGATLGEASGGCLSQSVG